MWLSLLALTACADPGGGASAFEPAPPAPPPPAFREPPGFGAPAGSTVASAFPPPEGAVRVEVGGFGAYVRELKLRAPDVSVLTHDGRVVRGHRARVIELPLVPGDLQQCADSILRVRAEYLRDTGAEVSFHATSGDPMPWSRYQAGERAYAVGNGLKWKAGSPATWEQYLAALFTWAGTASLEARETVPDTRPDPGDVVVQGGFPGHAVLILDVATRGDETFVLVGEGFMPAQDFHVELGPEQGWWNWRDGVALPHWPLPPEALRTWR